MRRVLLIANPSASGFTGALFRNVAATLGESFDVETAWPTGPAETRTAAREAADDGFYAVVAMGGDGVVHHAVNGLAYSTTALGIVPAGTTNVLARIVGLPGAPAKAARALRSAVPVAMPMAHVATESAVGARSEYAAFAAGIGFDAEVVAVAERRPYSKVHFGSVHYAWTAAKTVWSEYRGRAANLRVECAGRRVDAVAVMVQVHTPYTYFGRLPLRVTTDHVDGLAALAIERVTMRSAASILGRAVLRGRPEKAHGVHIWKGFEKLVVEAEPTAQFQADGELLGPTSTLEVSPADRSVLILVPRPDDQASP